MSKNEKRQELRTAALSRRRELSEAEFCLAGRSIQARALEFPPYLAASSVALYSPVEKEVETGEILAHALSHAKKVFFPRLRRRNATELVQISSVADLTMGRYGIPEPRGTHCLTGDEKELVVFVPGVVFDLQGHRLGRGRGWYDQLLNRLRPGAIFVGLAYEFQVVEEVPTQPWDEPVHYVITEKRLINCGAALPQSNSLLARHP